MCRHLWESRTRINLPHKPEQIRSYPRQEGRLGGFRNMTRITTVKARGYNTVVYRRLAGQLPRGIRRQSRPQDALLITVRTDRNRLVQAQESWLLETRKHLKTTARIPAFHAARWGQLRSGLTTAAVGHGVQGGLSQRATKAQRNSSLRTPSRFVSEGVGGVNTPRVRALSIRAARPCDALSRTLYPYGTDST
ncbi:hypothetical protein R1flu_028174 [Riccia fluitans]|uniref:Uncharacterized protein n=1 Tax=Riccia fluitans TaxID=41844 RepID=A0ABD1XNS8_9MARC